MTNTERLETLSKKVDEASSSLSSLEGERKVLIKRLKEEFGVNTIEEGLSLLEEIKQDQFTKAEELDELLGDIEEALNG